MDLAGYVINAVLVEGRGRGPRARAEGEGPRLFGAPQAIRGDGHARTPSGGWLSGSAAAVLSRGKSPSGSMLAASGGSTGLMPHSFSRSG
jgi:hypothetical protein